MKRSDEINLQIMEVDEQIGAAQDAVPDAPNLDDIEGRDNQVEARDKYQDAVVECRNQVKVLRTKRAALRDKWQQAIDTEEERVDQAVPTDAKSAEDQEWLELRSRCRTVNYINHALTRSLPLKGSAEEEFSQELLGEHGGIMGSQGGPQIPYDFFDDGPVDYAAEKEMRAVTIANGAREVNQAPVLERLFKDSDMGFLGANMVGVPPGIYSQATFATGASVSGTTAKGTDTSTTATTITVASVSPARIAASYTINVVDKAVLGTTEALHRRDLLAVMADGRDNFGVAQTDDTTAGAANTTDATTQWTWANYAFMGVNAVDGTYATGTEGLRLLMELSAWKDGAQLMFANRTITDATAPLSGIAYMEANGVAVRATSKLSASSGVGDQFMVRQRGEGIVMPTWGGVELIVENITGALQADERLTAIQVIGYLMPRKDKYLRISVKSSA